MPLQGADVGFLPEGLSKHSCVLSSDETQASYFSWCSLALAELRRVMDAAEIHHVGK